MDLVFLRAARCTQPSVPPREREDKGGEGQMLHSQIFPPRSWPLAPRGSDTSDVFPWGACRPPALPCACSTRVDQRGCASLCVPGATSYESVVVTLLLLSCRAAGAQLLRMPSRHASSCAVLCHSCACDTRRISKQGHCFHHSTSTRWWFVPGIKS